MDVMQCAFGIRNYEDNAEFTSAFDAVDTVIWHRYVATSEWWGVPQFISVPTDDNESETYLTVSNLVQDWEAAANNGKELDLLLGYAAPSLTGSAPKPGHNEVSLTYILQMTSELLAAGMDYASLFGFGSGQFGSLAFQDQAFIGGELWGLMAENLPGKFVVNGYQNNTGPVVNNSRIVDDSVNSYIFEDGDQVVVYLVAKDFSAASLNYTINLDDTFSGALATHLTPAGEYFSPRRK